MIITRSHGKRIEKSGVAKVRGIVLDNDKRYVVLDDTDRQVTLHYLATAADVAKYAN